MICEYCILLYGVDSDGNRLDGGGSARISTNEDYYNHLETMHDLVIRRRGETDEQAFERVSKKNSRVGTSDCRCPNCELRKIMQQRKSPLGEFIKLYDGSDYFGMDGE